MNKHEVELNELSKQLKNLNEIVLQLGKKKDVIDIIEMIKVKNGWTTLAEMDFMKAMVNSLTLQIKQVDQTISQMKSAAFKVEIH